MTGFPQPAAGDHHAEHLDARWSGVACQHHRGEAVVGYEERIDPETGEPRAAMLEVLDPSTGEVKRDGRGQPVHAMQIVQFPVHSERAGHQPDCMACSRAVLDTRLHVAAVEADCAQADFELAERLRARGLDPASIIGAR